MKYTVIKIRTCKKCPYHDARVESYVTKTGTGVTKIIPICGKTRRVLDYGDPRKGRDIVKNLWKIPEWCPLEDIDGKKRKKALLY